MLWFKKKKKEGCPACFEKDIISFGTDYLESKYESTIHLTEDFPEIGIYKCPKCNTKFFKNDYFYNRIIDEQLDRIHHWVRSDLRIEKTMLATLEEIGFSRNWNGESVAPCAIKLTNGGAIDFAVVKLSNYPPLGAEYDSYKSVYFIDEISTIESSRYALPIDVRKATETAEEMRMGFYPTITLSPNNQKVVLNGVQVLFCQNNIQGSELRLANEQWNHKFNNYLYSDHKIEHTLVIAKNK